MKKKAIMADLDGTLAIHNGRTPFEYHKLSTDLLCEPVADVVRRYLDDPEYTVIYCSGREGTDATWTATYQWLIDNGMWVDAFKTRLYMRQARDFRPDDIIKEEIYMKMIRPYFEVLFILDDRAKVVKKWRELGLTCFQTAEGNF